MVFWKTKNKNAIFGRYPCCEHINNAIRHCLYGETDSAIEELLQVILKSDGYLHSSLSDKVEKVHDRVCKRRIEAFKKIHQLKATITKNGQWVRVNETNTDNCMTYRCSVCGKTALWKRGMKSLYPGNTCPHCGADMIAKRTAVANQKEST